ncbi:xanthine dehydrogenase family protein subunit M [bacterium]|nr:xanthine dehydrogenase family protein subunit M [bacterium]
MYLPKFEFHEPSTVLEACQILTKYGKKATIIAGGTDVLVNMKKKIIAPKQLISIGRISGLSTIEESEGWIKIGACCLVSELAASDIIKKNIEALSESAINLGSPLVRNLATIGGNIRSARPAAELPPALIAYDAKLKLQSGKGERTVGLDGFFKGPGATIMEQDEIIVEIHIKIPPAHSGASYINLAVRKANDINIVNVASYISLDGKNGSIKSARIVMGCVGPKHLRALSAEKLLMNEQPSAELFAKAGEAAMTDCAPIDDFRGSAEYKKDMAGILTKRTLITAFDRTKD